MAIKLPSNIQEMKESSSTFFVDLYVFYLATGKLYLTSLDTDIDWFDVDTQEPVRYTALPIKRGKIEQTIEDKIPSVELEISNVSKEFSSILYNCMDIRGSKVAILQIAYPTSLNNSEAYKCVFYGYLDNPSLNEGTAIFKTNVLSIIPDMSMRRILGLSCNACFGNADECGVIPTVITGKVASNSTQNIIYDRQLNQSPDFWKNGVITISFESRKIIHSDIGYVQVEFPFFSTPKAGVEYKLINGCDQSLADCKRHGNTRNFGGFISIPKEEIIKT